MNPRDAISESDFYDPRDLAPVYYCEDCGKELHYPPESGCCWDCELTHETNHDDLCE